MQPAASAAVNGGASPAATGATGTASGGGKTMVNGGRFDFDDGGTYCGGWEDGKAHGHGVCTGPKGQGAYAGSWHYGFEVSGVYTWPSGSSFEGQWQNGKRHGLGVEARGRWLYRGEWTQGFKGRYGVRQAAASNARYEGTWANGLQDGYGSETYADGGTYQGQWLRGMRHGYGVRASAPFGMASHYRPNKATIRASMTSLRSTDATAGDPAAERDRRVDDSRGGFVLKARSDEPPQRRGSLVERSIKKSILSGLKIRKQRSTGDLEKRGTSASIRSTGSSASWVSTESEQSAVTSASMHTDSNASFVVEDEHLDASVTETYMGEWKNDKRSGFGISERSDGLRYEGEWFNNKKYGYGVTTLRDGSKEEGKYKNNVLITSQKKKHLFLIRSAKFRERVDAAVNAAQRASKIALQKADIAISRTATARGKAELADLAAEHAREDSDIALETARQFAPDFHQLGLERVRGRETTRNRYPNEGMPPPKSILHQPSEKSASDHNPTQHVTMANQYSSVRSLHQAPPPPPQTSEPPQTSTAAAPDVEESRLPNSLPPPQGLPQTGDDDSAFGRHASIRRGSHVKATQNESPAFSYQQSMNDRFDHYKRPPSRDSSVDRYSRAAARLGGGGSRQPSVDKPALLREPSQDRTARAPSAARGTTPVPGTPTAGNGAALGPGTSQQSLANSFIPPFEEVILRKRGLGQDIIPSPGQPKRTESLYINPINRKEAQPKAVPLATPLQRKKSLPDVQGLPTATDPMSREEVSVLSSARREEMRRQQEESERLRANPLLYLVSPHVKDWFSRQQLVLIVLFINISLAIMFFKLLT